MIWLVQETLDRQHPKIGQWINGIKAIRKTYLYPHLTRLKKTFPAEELDTLIAESILSYSQLSMLKRWMYQSILKPANCI